MSFKSGTRKRAYRSHRNKCNECETEMNVDHANTHIKNVHGGKKMNFTPLVETSHMQSQLRGFFVNTSASNTTTAEPTKASGTHTET